MDLDVLIDTGVTKFGSTKWTLYISLMSTNNISDQLLAFLCNSFTSHIGHSFL